MLQTAWQRVGDVLVGRCGRFNQARGCHEFAQVDALVLVVLRDGTEAIVCSLGILQ